MAQYVNKHELPQGVFNPVTLDGLAFPKPHVQFGELNFTTALESFYSGKQFVSASKMHWSASELIAYGQLSLSIAASSCCWEACTRALWGASLLTSKIINIVIFGKGSFLFTSISKYPQEPLTLQYFIISLGSTKSLLSLYSQTSRSCPTAQ